MINKSIYCLVLSCVLMRLVMSALVFAALSNSMTVTGQDGYGNTAEESSSLLAERDAKWGDAVELANYVDLDKASELLGQVFKIERSIFGDAHEELLGTLSWQARLAHDAKS